ncbi:probable membrane-associated kinase regulator 2 [Trifolium pratense]|uniref:probable membrane-associated kinase regulator 2 n=1 Tax=Trifolium pratense TaxID=57577 RepID=UPI001E692DBE|nr:probable membrane-associated kinase regulator 2 [Trifolium pratense]
MEAFTLLKYWKPTQETLQPTTLPEIATTEEEEDIQITTDEEEEEEDEPYFDLHFTVPEEEDEEQEQPEEELVEANESDSEFRFTISPATNEKVQLELDSSQPNSKPQFTASFFKSATKFRVFMLGLNKSKSSTAQNPNQQQPELQKKKLFTVKFKVDEVPFVSFFTRDNSSKGKTATDDKVSSKEKKQDNTEEESQLHSPSSEDKMSFSKEVMQKYLKKVKPLYVKVSRKYAEKLRFSGQLNTSPVKKPATEKVETEVDTTKNGGKDVKCQKQGTLPLPAGLRVVCKRLGKSRSASSATPSPDATTVSSSSRRRDDSIVQQQDGIQSAILHCKSSFNASKECGSSSEIETMKKSCLQNELGS